MQSKYKAGFTLIELLVVISIIGILMGVLIPALAAARGRAQTIVCGSNLKNYGSALPMYADTNNDKVPFSFYWLYSKTTIGNTGLRGCPEECRWHYDKDQPDGSLWPYLRNIKAHICPTFKSLAKTMTCSNPSHRANLPYHPTYCYSMNRWLGFRPPAEYYTVDSQSAEAEAMIASEPTLNYSKVNRPAECCAFSEENLWTIDHREGDKPGYYYSMTPIGKNDLWLYANKSWKEGAQGNLATYHNVSPSKKDYGKANVVFVDGHVSLVRGLAGYDAYFEYGRPFRGHEDSLPNFW